MKITKCEIIKGKWDSEVYGTFENGERKLLFRYYWDEISFSEDEFIGLTEDEAHELFHKRDIEYLRS